MNNNFSRIKEFYLSDKIMSNKEWGEFKKLSISDNLLIMESFLTSRENRLVEMSIPYMIYSDLRLTSDRKEGSFGRFKQQVLATEKFLETKFDTLEEITKFIKVFYIDDPKKREHKLYSNLTDSKKEVFWDMLRVWFEEFKKERDAL